MESYNIFCKDKLIFESLTEDEYFDAMEDLAQEYYKTGVPDPMDLETKIITGN